MGHYSSLIVAQKGSAVELLWYQIHFETAQLVKLTLLSNVHMSATTLVIDLASNSCIHHAGSQKNCLEGAFTVTETFILPERLRIDIQQPQGKQ